MVVKHAAGRQNTVSRKVRRTVSKLTHSTRGRRRKCHISGPYTLILLPTDWLRKSLSPACYLLRYSALTGICPSVATTCPTPRPAFQTGPFFLLPMAFVGPVFLHPWVPLALFVPCAALILCSLQAHPSTCPVSMRSDVSSISNALRTFYRTPNLLRMHVVRHVTHRTYSSKPRRHPQCSYSTYNEKRHFKHLC